jgi:hypothetical protein
MIEEPPPYNRWDNNPHNYLCLHCKNFIPTIHPYGICKTRRIEKRFDDKPHGDMIDEKVTGGTCFVPDKDRIQLLILPKWR